MLNDSLFIFPSTKITDKKSHYISFNFKTAHQHSHEQLDCRICTLTRLINQVEESRENIISSNQLFEYLTYFNEDNIKYVNKDNGFILMYKFFE